LPGEQNVLTQDRVERFQLTSGSTSASKLIPWTAASAAEFSRSLAAWVHALYRWQPACCALGLLVGLAARRQTKVPGSLPLVLTAMLVPRPFRQRLFDLVSAVPAQATRPPRSICSGIRPWRPFSPMMASRLSPSGVPRFHAPAWHFLARRDAVLKLMADRGGSCARPGG